MDDYRWLVWSDDHGGWWKPNHRGYTRDIAMAGRYTLRQAQDIVIRAACPSADLVTGSITDAFPERMVRAPEHATEGAQPHGCPVCLTTLPYRPDQLPVELLPKPAIRDQHAAIVLGVCGHWWQPAPDAQTAADHDCPYCGRPPATVLGLWEEGSLVDPVR